MIDRVGHSTFDALHGKAAAAQDIGRLRRPRRDCPETRHDPETRGPGHARRGTQDGAQPRQIERLFGTVGGDEVNVPGSADPTAGMHAFEFTVEPFEAKR